MTEADVIDFGIRWVMDNGLQGVSLFVLLKFVLPAIRGLETKVRELDEDVQALDTRVEKLEGAPA